MVVSTLGDLNVAAERFHDDVILIRIRAMEKGERGHPVRARRRVSLGSHLGLKFFGKEPVFRLRGSFVKVDFTLWEVQLKRIFYPESPQMAVAAGVFTA